MKRRRIVIAAEVESDRPAREIRRAKYVALHDASGRVLCDACLDERVTVRVVKSRKEGRKS